MVMAASGKEAVANAKQWHTYPPGYCLKWVRAECWQIGGLYGSAIDAWYGAKHRHPGDRTPPLGAPMFYSGGQYGHIVICTVDNKPDMRSTDCTSTGQVSGAHLDWPVHNWGQTYLGWTEDLNGVRLPLGDEDEMTPEDWDKLRRIVKEELDANNAQVVDAVWHDERTATQPDGDKVTKTMSSMVRQTWERVVKL